VRFGTGRELRSFHADDSAAVVELDAFTCERVAALTNDLVNFSVGRLGNCIKHLTFASFSSNGSAKPTCPTTPFSKKVNGRTPKGHTTLVSATSCNHRHGHISPPCSSYNSRDPPFVLSMT